MLGGHNLMVTRIDDLAWQVLPTLHTLAFALVSPARFGHQSQRAWRLPAGGRMHESHRRA